MRRRHIASMTDPDLRIRVLSAISQIAAPDWDACANPTPLLAAGKPSSQSTVPTLEPPSPAAKPQRLCAATSSSEARGTAYNPFLSHAFLHALEISGSATARTGWLPQHLVAETAAGATLGVAPCYLKSHSRGEYVFDHSWADAYERAGGNYYPKLQVSVPFTPATGRRLLARTKGPDQEVREIQAALAMGLVQLCETLDSSSVHVTFATEPECDLLGGHGFLRRTDQQFHWNNADYGTFDDFLAALSARKRKTIRRERRDALPPGIEVQWLTGSDLTEAVWDAFFAFYMETGSRKWGRPYLTRAFYSLIGQTMANRILLVMAKRAGRFIAGAINFIGSDTLYGRHWGAIEHHPFLHFELCYYQAIDYAIAHGLQCVEAGAQGEHKLARGYLPVLTHSAHHIADPRLRRAVADYLKHERAYVEAAGRELIEAAPFRKDLSLDGPAERPEP
jgi:predicted N-acyltransferase